jgi:hypothetical protein
LGIGNWDGDEDEDSDGRGCIPCNIHVVFM